MPAHQGPSSSARRARALLRAALVLAGLGAVAAMVIGAEPRAVLRACAAIGPGVVLLFVAPLAGFALHSLGWRTLLPDGVRPGVGRGIRIYIAAQAGDEVGFGILGEPLKAVALPPAYGRQAWAAMALDNTAQLVAFGAYLALATAVLLAVGSADAGSPPVDAVIRTALLGAAGTLGLAALLLSIVSLGGRPRPAVAGSGPVGRALFRCRSAAAGARELLRSRPRRFAACILLHVGGKLWLVAEMALGLWMLGRASVAAAVGLALASSVGSFLGAPIPAQLGATEGALALAGPGLGVPLPDVMALALLRRLRLLLWIGVGLREAARPTDGGAS